MIKPYKKDAGYSYTQGFFPTFELLRKKKDKLIAVYVSEDALESEGYKKLSTVVEKDKLIVSSKTVERLGMKGNDHVIGVFRKYDEKLDPSLPHVVLVNPSDMGNLGNIMRSMLAFSYHDLAIITPAADRFAPHTIRSSMGAFFSIRQETFPSFESYLQAYPRPYYPFMLNEKAHGLKETEIISPAYALVFGNEATGLPRNLGNENTVFIEQSKDVDSLNLATSVVLALYQFSLNH